MNKLSFKVMALSTLLSSCGVLEGNQMGTLHGESATMNGSPITTWATVDWRGRVTQVGVTVPLGAIRKAPVQGAPSDLQLDFPEVVQRTTFLNHLGLDWNPEGHEPTARYGVPHVDLHFYTVNKAQLKAVDCRDLTQVDPASLPPGWLPPVPPGAPPTAFCVPQMGFHSLPATEFSAPGKLHAGTFDKVMILGSYGGKFTFLEPMVTRELLLTGQNFSLPVPVPQNLSQATHYPTRLNASYDRVADAYQFVLSDFRQVQ